MPQKEISENHLNLRMNNCGRLASLSGWAIYRHPRGARQTAKLSHSNLINKAKRQSIEAFWVGGDTRASPFATLVCPFAPKGTLGRMNVGLEALV